MKSDYKQTEVGALPHEWEVSSFGAMFNISAGGDVDPKRSRSYRDEIHRYPIYSNALPNFGLYGFCSYSDHPAGSITVTARGMVGAANFRDHAYTAIGRVLVLDPKNEISGRYFSEVINSRVAFANESTGVPQLTAPQIAKYQLPVPPIAEQHAIADALNDADALLGALDRLIAKKRDLKQAAMQQLLTGEKRLPGFHDAWESKTLRHICEKIQDGTHFSPKMGGNDFLYVTSKNIRFGRLDMSTAQRISSAEHAKIYARCDVRKGDLLLTKDGANTGNAALNSLNEPFSLLSSVAMLRFDSRRHVPGYFMHQILSAYGQSQIKEAMSGNAITRLTLEKINALRFPIASLPEQIAIAEALSEMDAEIAALEQRRDKTRALKQGMMQELLTGKTRLVSPEAVHG